LRLVLDSDVLVHALRMPKRKDLYALHEKASKLFESCIEKKNELFLPSMIPIEVGAVLSKIMPQELAREGIEKLLTTAKEVYPFTEDTTLNSVYSISSNIYFEMALENSLKLTRIVKDENDSWVPSWKDKREVMVGGMDVFVLTYAELKEAVLITNDWALWYVAWKRRIICYWLSGLSGEHVSKITDAVKVDYPER
jgi:predicted nucleic acid-binding protein